MSRAIFDLSVSVWNKMAKFRAEKRGHRLISAYKSGILSGLHMGELPMKLGFSLAESSNMWNIIDDSSRSLPDAIKEASKFLPDGHTFTEAMFRKGHYRNEEDTTMTYSLGFMTGFDYVFQLKDAMTNPSSDVVARRAAVDHLKVITEAIERM